VFTFARWYRERRPIQSYGVNALCFPPYIVLEQDKKAHHSYRYSGKQSIIYHKLWSNLRVVKIELGGVTLFLKKYNSFATV